MPHGTNSAEIATGADPRVGISDLLGAKPCPFCGSNRIVKGERYFAMCVDCGATGPERNADATERKFVGDWNTRSSAPISTSPLETEGSSRIETKKAGGCAVAHAGDCSIYAALMNRTPLDGICTCGYGWECVRRGDWDKMFSNEWLEANRTQAPNSSSTK